MVISSKIYGAFENAILKKRHLAEYTEFCTTDFSQINKTFYKPVEPLPTNAGSKELCEIADSEVSVSRLAEIAAQHGVGLASISLNVYHDSSDDYTMYIYSNETGPDPKYFEKLERYIKDLEVYNAAIERQQKLKARFDEFQRLFDSTLKKITESV